MYYIYQIKFKNQLLYIGRTNNPINRWNHHKTHETNEVLKYYFDNNNINDFTFNIIKDNLTYQQAKQLEAKLIQYYSQYYYLANEDIGDQKSLLTKDRISISLHNFWDSERSSKLKEKLKRPTNVKKIYDINTKLFFNSITDAAKHFNISRNAIYYRLQRGYMQYI